MKKESSAYCKFLLVLEEELVPALGCTEPIAIAYAAATARKVLNAEPDRLEVQCSGNIIKNAKSVVVPNTGSLRGIEASAIIGALAGNAEKGLETLCDVTEEAVQRTKALCNTRYCKVSILKSTENLHLKVFAYHGTDTAMVEICREHTNIVHITKNSETLLKSADMCSSNQEAANADRSWMTLDSILDFAASVDIADIKELLDRQIECNERISIEGLEHPYGACVGRTLLECYGGEDIEVRVRARAAAGSDARMGGCVLPVVINSGSGNQGITVTLPVIEYSNYIRCSNEKRYRALVLSNLIALYEKTAIGRLSAFCGAVSAACGSGAAITYLAGGGKQEIEATIANTLGNAAGIVCDGAKPSCAAKISTALSAAMLGHYMAMKGRRFQPGEGLVKSTADRTVAAIGKMANTGMRTTDQTILEIMVNDPE